MGENVFSIAFESDILQVNRVIEDALGFLMGFFPNLSRDTAFDIKLVMSEALYNAVTHGNDEDRGKMVSLKIEAYADQSITIQIHDEGMGFDHASIIAREANDDHTFSETGRGVKLVRELSDGISYNREGNRLKIYKKVDFDA